MSERHASGASAAELYWKEVIDEAPRTLGLMDREPLSPTAGCCDRTFWAWKFTDFPGARFQEALCVLGFLHATRRPDNPYWNNPRVLAWIELGLRFWMRQQHRDGSFDEAYPHERSLAATAFTAFYVAEALGFCGEALDPTTRADARSALARAGAWLCRNDETHGVLSNHLAAAAAALRHIHVLTDSRECAQRSDFFLERIVGRQSREGWYEEYGGADPGYQTHGSFYLARIWELTGSAHLLESLQRSTAFLTHCLHPDGSLGGEYASRNTQTYYPAAFEMLAGVDDAALAIARTMRASVTNGAAACLGGIDAYNYFPLLNNLVFAYRAASDGAAGDRSDAMMEPAPGRVWFPDAGLLRVRTACATVLVGTSKGGVVKVFSGARRALSLSDCGFLGRLHDGRLCSTQYLDRARPTEVSDGRVVVSGFMMECARPTMSPFRFLAFRLFMLTVGGLPALARWLKGQLVRVLITRRRALAITFRRTIEITPRELVVEDELAGADLSRLAGLWRGAHFTTVHMGSSRYFIAQEIQGTGPASGLEAVPIPRGTDRVVVRRAHPLA
ncbi:MAG TPA: hypothetical protein VLE53_09345 [Gemmatimonadaceae bacterium]|nr:hypothetical protein [Gemmatimonadaceae bacterium]